MSKTILYTNTENNYTEQKRILLKPLLKHIATGDVIINTNIKKIINCPNPYHKDYCLIFKNKVLQNPEIIVEINKYIKDNQNDKNLMNLKYKCMKEVDYKYYVLEWEK